MHNTKHQLIDELIEIDQQISHKLWNLADAHSKPTGLSPRVIYPIRGGKTVRVSEQETRIVCCGVLDNLSLYYSIETPTEKTYRQSGKKAIRARTDLTIYTFDGQSLHRAINVEFKGPQAKKEDVGKDIEKLVREGCFGGWFHILRNSNRGTFRSLFSKFQYGFIEYPKLFSPEEFSSKRISILFCFCVLAKQHAYMRHFLYEPSQDGYEEYVTSFLNASSLDTYWRLFTKDGPGGSVQRKNSTSHSTFKARPTTNSEVKKAWCFGKDRNGLELIFAFVNSKGSCSIRRFRLEDGTQIDWLPNKKGNYQDNFQDHLKNSYPLRLSSQPNLESDCKTRLPEWVMAEIRKQIKPLP